MPSLSSEHSLLSRREIIVFLKVRIDCRSSSPCCRPGAVWCDQRSAAGQQSPKHAAEAQLCLKHCDHSGDKVHLSGRISCQ